MNSNDVYVIVNDEQQFRLYVVEQFGKMDARMSRIETRLDGLESRVENLEADVKGLHAEIKHVSDEQIAFSAKMDMLLWGTGIIIGAATLAVTLWSLFKPQTHPQQEAPKPAPSPAPVPTVITIPQLDINAIARQIGEMFNLEPRR